MPKFCANLSLLFTELPMAERPAAAARAGFDAVEVLFPYEENAADLGHRIAQAKVPLALINCPPPNFTDPTGPRGFAAVPGEEARFRVAFRRALRFAGALGAQHLHVMAGVASGEAARAVFVENLIWATAEAPRQSLTIEPINTHDMPGYFLDSFDLAETVLDAVAAPNLGLQFDVYHAARMGLDVMATWDRLRDRVVHVQVGGVPDRHEPFGPDQGGGFDYPAFFNRLDQQKYRGWVSGEYHPKNQTEEGLDWIRG